MNLFIVIKFLWRNQGHFYGNFSRRGVKLSRSGLSVFVQWSYLALLCHKQRLYFVYSILYCNCILYNHPADPATWLVFLNFHKPSIEVRIIQLFSRIVAKSIKVSSIRTECPTGRDEKHISFMQQDCFEANFRIIITEAVGRTCTTLRAAFQIKNTSTELLNIRCKLSMVLYIKEDSEII